MKLSSAIVVPYMFDILPQEKKVVEYLKTKKTHNNVYLSCTSVFMVKTNICYLTHILTGYIGKSLSTLTKDKIQNAKR